jgi:hypothetical protein
MKLNRQLMLFCFPLFGVLLTAYSPMASYSMAQSSIDAQVQSMKQKATDEINRRIANYQKTLANMKDVAVSANGGSGSPEVAPGDPTGKVTCSSDDPTLPTPAASTSPSPSANPSTIGLHIVIALPCGFKEKVKTALQNIVTELTTLKDKVTKVTNLDDMQKLAQNIDAQFKLDQVTQVQAEVSQAVSSMSGTLDGIKTTFSDIQSRVTALKDCSDDGVTTPSASVSPSASPAAGQCRGLNKEDAKSAEDQGQSQLDGISTIISSISSIIMSAITLIVTLLTSFMGIVGGLGGGGGLGNIGSLGSMLGGGSAGGAGGLTSLLGSAGGLGGLMSGFTGILGQLNIGQSMAGGASSSLGSLGNLLGGVNLP